MFIETGFDSSLVFLVFILAIVGLIRGFLSELASIINWFGSFYLTSKLKPFFVPFFKDKIHIPFLLDMVVNAILFCSLIIGISIINKFLVSKLKQIVPSHTNSGLGFLFGFAKGVLLGCLILAFFSVIYNNSSNQPSWLDNSYIYNSTKNKNELFIGMINSILGELVDEDFEKINRKRKDRLEQEIQKIKEIKDTTDDLNTIKNEFFEKLNIGIDSDKNESKTDDVNSREINDIDKLIDIIGD